MLRNFTKTKSKLREFQKYSKVILAKRIPWWSTINKISSEETDGQKQLQRILSMLLVFAEKNPGMTRVLIGDALVNEDEKLQVRINQLTDRIEVTLKQSLRIAETQTGHKTDAEAQANLMLCYVMGRWQQFAKSGFKRKPMEFAQQQIVALI